MITHSSTGTLRTLAAHFAETAPVALDPDGKPAADIHHVVDDVAEERRLHDGSLEPVFAVSGRGVADEGEGFGPDRHRRGGADGPAAIAAEPVLPTSDHRSSALAARARLPADPVHEPHEIRDEQVRRPLVDLARRSTCCTLPP